MPKRDETLTAFGRNVAKFRNERGFSQDKLAEGANLDHTYPASRLSRRGTAQAVSFFLLLANE
jgi:transcriptional regulator with XRE-family HTH domain